LQLLAYGIEFDDPISQERREFASPQTLERSAAVQTINGVLPRRWEAAAPQRHG